MADVHMQHMCFVCHDRLHSPCFPQMQLLLLRPALVSVKVEVLEHDHVRVIEHGEVDDSLRRQDGDVLVRVVSSHPQVPYAPRAMRLRMLDMVDLLPETVVFSGEFKELPPQDRAIRQHRRSGAAVVDPKVYAYGGPLKEFRFAQLAVSLVREVQRPYFHLFCMVGLHSFLHVQ